MGDAISRTPLFIVRHVSDDVMDDLGVRVVGMTEDPEDGSARCFLFQRALTGDTDEDRRLEIDTYAISNEHGVSSYAPLSSYEVRGGTLVLNFTEKGARILGVPQHATLELDLASHDIEVLTSSLREVIGT